MTLEGCIEYFEIEAETSNSLMIPYESRKKYSDDCKQMAEWLRELKELRELLKRTENRVHPACSECKYMKAKYEEQPCRNCCNNYRSRFEREVNNAVSD